MDSQEDGFGLDFTATPEAGGQSRVAEMKQVLINERAAPELLHYREDLVQHLEELVAKQEEAIQGLARIQGAESELVRAVFTQEVNRVKFLLRAYLRCRLLKVERFVMHTLDAEPQQAKLAPREMQYAKDYFFLFGRHMRASVLKHLPPEFSQITRQSNASEQHDMVAAPRLSRHVFVRVLEDVGSVELDDQGADTADFREGDLYVVRYSTVQRMLQEGQVQLV